MSEQHQSESAALRDLAAAIKLQAAAITRQAAAAEAQTQAMTRLIEYLAEADGGDESDSPAKQHQYLSGAPR